MTFARAREDNPAPCPILESPTRRGRSLPGPPAPPADPRRQPPRPVPRRPLNRASPRSPARSSGRSSAGRWSWAIRVSSIASRSARSSRGSAWEPTGSPRPPTGRTKRSARSASTPTSRCCSPSATALTIAIISFAYTKIIEQFPLGGGGYAVASKFLGPSAGVVSGTALVIDYVLTIAVSIASGGEAVFSYLPLRYQPLKLPVEFAVIVILMVLNLRGVKESVRTLLPFFVLFVATHLILIVGGIASHLDRVPEVASELHGGFRMGLGTLGAWGMFLLFIRAYSMGAGTYTGIEAVSNGIGIMREPRIPTGKRTMAYMAASLAFTAGGIIVCYLLFGVRPVEGKTMNAVLIAAFAGDWRLAGIPIGYLFVILTLTSEAILLFVAAQAGFTDGPRVMANMANDSWLPHRFAALSERLTMRDGILLMGGGAIVLLAYTGGNVTHLVVMYSINVFVTFSLSQLAMVRHWLQVRGGEAPWKRNIGIHAVGLVLCVSILVVTVVEKFELGGWVTIALTGAAVAVCALTKRHYRKTYGALAKLEHLVELMASPDPSAPVPEFDPKKPTAVLLVGSYGGLGIHSLLSIYRFFPKYFHNVVFVSVGVLDSGNFKGVDGVRDLQAKVDEDLRKYVAVRPEAELARAVRARARDRGGVGGRGAVPRPEPQVPSRGLLRGEADLPQGALVPDVPAQRDRLQRPAPPADGRHPHDDPPGPRLTAGAGVTLPPGEVIIPLRVHR